ncbi:hypothetical protein PILCRDRAFT_216262 [Piloderma croceum F 1598]|uniref:Uncharacterized protein n=1 Tax=Piloderma croceum (strain F 1598) TaxID=765440 RepID=A0A0C3GBV3_PILCF|nr:hypothetical protein PILCRDRAFT_216262 [Piloderma croceum F 1598]
MASGSTNGNPLPSWVTYLQEMLNGLATFYPLKSYIELLKRNFLQKLVNIHKFGDMMSDGYICTPEDLALSRNSSVPLVYCLTRGQSFGLLLNAESAVISLISVTLVFVLLLCASDTESYGFVHALAFHG